MKDYYKILGVNKKSTKDEIKKSYRKLSKKYHPDVNPDGDEKFKEISEAYDVLSDDNKKSQYDNPNPFNGRGGNGFNPFSEFMGQFRSQQQRRRKGPDKKINMVITPIDSFNGVSKDITYQINYTCKPCAGSGGKKNVCQTCEGSGNIRRKVGSGFFTQVMDTPCHECQGNGQIMIDPCFECGGSGIKQKIENEKNKVVKPEANPDTGEVPLRTGIANAILDKKMNTKDLVQSKKKKEIPVCGKTKIEINPNKDIGNFSGGMKVNSGNLH